MNDSPIQAGLHFSGQEFGLSDEFPLGIVRHQQHPDKEIHTHDFAELVIVYHGTTTHVTPGNQVRLKPGDLLVVPKGASHGYRESHNLTLVNVMYDPDRLHLPESDLRRLPGYHVLFLMGGRPGCEICPMHLEQSRLDVIARIVERIEREISGGAPGYMAMALAHLSQLIVQLSRYCSAAETADGRPHQRIAAAISHIENNIERDINLTELTELTHLSASSLLRAFKAAVGMPPMEYHLHQRIRRSCRYLRTTDFSVTQIAYRVGFHDGSYFSRQFKKRMQMTPTQYRDIPAL